MFKIVLQKSVNVRSGDVPLRFRLRDGKDVDLAYEAGKMISAKDMMAFAQDGSLKPGVELSDTQLVEEIERYKSALSETYLSLCQEGVALSDEVFQLAVEEYLRKQAESDLPENEYTLVGRFRLYLKEEHECGRISDKRYRESSCVSRKLERYLAIRERPKLSPKEFTLEMVVDFEKFCVDEYLYAANPKYAHLYPRGYAQGRFSPKHKMQEETLRKMLIHFQTFWMDLVSFGEVERSPYADYVSWMQPKKYKCYTEMMGDPLTLTMAEFQNVIYTPYPEDMAGVRNALILQCCLGCLGEDFKELSFDNLKVSEEGIPYIYYRHTNTRRKKNNTTDVEVPVVRIAFDILMRTRMEFYYGTQNASYNRLIRKFLRFCGITREVCLYNTRNSQCELVPICDAISQCHLQLTHIDILHEMDALRGLRGPGNTGPKLLSKMKQKVSMEEHFERLNKAFGQKRFRVDENLNIVEGAPFVMRDPLVYKEVPEKCFNGATTPYIITQMQPLPSDEGRPEDRIEIIHYPALLRERPVLLCGDQFTQFVNGLEDKFRVRILYGVLLLRRLADFEVTFIKQVKGSIYSLCSSFRGYDYSTLFYLNGEAVVLLYGQLVKRPRPQAHPPVIEVAELEKMRWAHVTGSASASDYGLVLDGIFGAAGTPAREKSWAKACSWYVSQTLRRAREAAGMEQVDVFSQWGLKDDCGNLAHAENGTRVLPFKYLRRLLAALGYKAMITRPVVEE